MIPFLRQPWVSNRWDITQELPNQKLDKFRSFGNPFQLFGKPCQNFTKLLRSGLNDLLLRRLSPRVSLMVLTKIDVDRPMRISDGGSNISKGFARSQVFWKTGLSDRYTKSRWSHIRSPTQNSSSWRVTILKVWITSWKVNKVCQNAFGVLLISLGDLWEDLFLELGKSSKFLEKLYQNADTKGKSIKKRIKTQILRANRSKRRF